MIWWRRQPKSPVEDEELDDKRRRVETLTSQIDELAEQLLGEAEALRHTVEAERERDKRATG